MMNVWQSHVMKVFLFACITSVIVIVFVWIWIGSGTMPCTKYHLVVLGTIPSKYFLLGRVPIWYEIFLHYGYDSRYIILIGSATTQNMRKILICSDTKLHTYYWLDWVPHLEHETIFVGSSTTLTTYFDYFLWIEFDLDVQFLIFSMY